MHLKSANFHFNVFIIVLLRYKKYSHLNCIFIGCVFWHQNGVRCCLACASRLRQSHNRECVVSRCNRAKTAHSTYFVLQTFKRRNRPCHFHALIEMPVVRLSAEPPRDQNQLSAQLAIKYNILMPHEAKETHPM